VVQLAEHPVEQVPQRGRVAVAAFAAAQVVLPRRGWPGGGGERPAVADRGEPVVLGPPPGHGAGLARGSGDRGGPGERLQRPVVGEPGPVVTDLGQHDRAGDVGQAGEAGDDLVVRVMRERLGQGGGEAVGRVADGVQDGEQSKGLGAHRLLHQPVLAQLRNPQGGHNGGGPGGDPALPAAAAKRRLHRRLGHLQALLWAGRDRQHGAGIPPAS
jgi:hypothetical protein